MKDSKAAIVAEELLILLAYGVDLLTRPTFRNWDDSYEGWLSRNGLLKRVHYLEAQKFLIRENQKHGWVYKLTASGRAVAAGGRDPEALWQRPWDGLWRQFVFDLPMSQHRMRPSLIRWLRSNGFGYLQDSVWISPDPVDAVAKTLKPFRDDAGSFTVLHCQCAPGFSNSSLVKGAWPCVAINDQYRRYEQFAATAARTLQGRPLHPKDLFSLMRIERRIWRKAFHLDPLLPLQLWPRDYAGRRAWRSRLELLRHLSKHVPSRGSDE